MDHSYSYSPGKGSRLSNFFNTDAGAGLAVKNWLRSKGAQIIERCIWTRDRGGELMPNVSLESRSPVSRINAMSFLQRPGKGHSVSPACWSGMFFWANKLHWGRSLVLL